MPKLPYPRILVSLKKVLFGAVVEMLATVLDVETDWVAVGTV